MSYAILEEVNNLLLDTYCILVSLLISLKNQISEKVL